MTETEVLPAVKRAELLASETSIFFNVAKFEHGFRVANMFAASTMVPEQFRGNSGNCMIALNYAGRIGADPFMMMQTMHVIHGKPGIEGKLVAALINQSGKYSEPLRYEWLTPEDNPTDRHIVVGSPTDDERGCRAVAVDAKSGTNVIGPKITWKIVNSEGWYGKPGSKWKTIPELMFMYRAASWFANVHCPEVKLGMHTVEEIKDFVDMAPGPSGSFEVPKGEEKAGANVTYYPDPGGDEFPPEKTSKDLQQDETTPSDTRATKQTQKPPKRKSEIDPDLAAKFEALAQINASTFWNSRESGVKGFFEKHGKNILGWPQEVRGFIRAKCLNLGVSHYEDLKAEEAQAGRAYHEVTHTGETEQTGTAGEEPLSPSFLQCPDGKKVAFFQCEECRDGPTCKKKSDYIESQKM